MYCGESMHTSGADPGILKGGGGGGGGSGNFPPEIYRFFSKKGGGGTTCNENFPGLLCSLKSYEDF